MSVDGKKLKPTDIQLTNGWTQPISKHVCDVGMDSISIVVCFGFFWALGFTSLDSNNLVCTVEVSTQTDCSPTVQLSTRGCSSTRVKEVRRVSRPLGSEAPPPARSLVATPPTPSSPFSASHRLVSGKIHARSRCRSEVPCKLLGKRKNQGRRA